MRKNLAFRIGAATIPLEEMVDKNIVATKPVNIYRQVRPTLGAVVYTAKAGENIGRLYSWVGGGTSPLYLLFYDNQQRPYYMAYDNNINFDILGQQGARTYEQVEKDRQEQADGGSMFPDFPNPFEGLNEGVKKALTTGAIILAVAGGVWIVTRK